MHFTLTFQGRLPSSSNAAAKNRIRADLHPQLKELWRTHPALVGNLEWVSRSVEDDPEAKCGQLLKKIRGHDFAVLVHPSMQLYAELDIFILRPEPPGAVISHSGDIDNQLKTLFDALRRPVDESELPKSWTPSPDEDPLHCLLDDDKLITRVNVNTDRLLKPNVDPKDVEVTIQVTIKGITATWGNIGLIA
ncbi:hypothetical protein [Micromonospora sp. CB01531]|uniref:hypothetical protein n=1 Tax=Micromonospora sp. CB01531 TaxID=1718947 RepID=UPI00093FE585|nr:hypothetical protein [Micromonospora sp. CB01531]